MWPFKKSEKDKVKTEIQKRYHPVPDDARLPDLSNGIFELDDVLLERLESNTGLSIDFENKKEQLRAGDLAKLTFRITDVDAAGEEIFGVESMWVMIRQREGDLFLGVLDNDPYCTDKLTAGHQLWFHKNHILRIFEPREE